MLTGYLKVVVYSRKVQKFKKMQIWFGKMKNCHCPQKKPESGRAKISLSNASSRTLCKRAEFFRCAYMNTPEFVKNFFFETNKLQLRQQLLFYLGWTYPNSSIEFCGRTPETTV
eukprot:Pompholyxophrys_sp_v1_NODE_225_length_1065_cov_5.570297.p1 type:complete len:114 gc:universal NODE_225_length_1065_cov_5.570297:750-409(-)